MDFSILASLGVFALAALELLAIYFAFRAIGHSRTPQGAVAWVVFLISAPIISVAAYLFLGHSRVRGYTISRRESVEVLAGMSQFSETFPARGDVDHVGYSAFEKAAEVPILSGNSMELLLNGDETFDAIFETIDAAKSYILIQFYIVRDDTLGRALADRLIAAANRSVSVRFLYDSVGCSRLPSAYVTRLSDAGIEMLDSNALRGPTKRFQINFRNHRKSLVIDGETGFTGGHNVGVEYLGQDKKYGAWRDTHVHLKGPVVSQLQLVFCEDWFWATNTNLISDLHWQVTPADENMDAVIVPTGPADVLNSGSIYFMAAIAAAKERIWIASPYFVPPEDIMGALKLAALKGVEVRILVPDKADHQIPWLAAFAYFDELMQVGVEIWRYDAGFLHQKVLVVDESIASVGTLNLDNRSCLLNFEATAVFFDARAARDVVDMMTTDFVNAVRMDTPITGQSWRIRILAPFARLFSPLL